ncbi:MAG: hypothetical protein QOE70_3689 [Chthoniobacter sp.]|nr:hypothetical protein [Chthoniobacter sp.]
MDDQRFTLGRGSYLLFLGDATREAVSIYRDPWGALPVYFTEDGSVISDQLTDLVRLAPATGFNTAPVSEYLSCSYIVGSRTLYTGVRAMTSMQGLRADAQGAQAFTNHQYPSTDSSITQDDLVAALEAAVTRSVSQVAARLPDPTQLCVSLSGGTDSSLLVAELREQYGPAAFLCGTVEYLDWARNDTPYFQKVVDRYQLPAYIQTVDNGRYARSFEELQQKARYPYHTFTPSFNALMSGVRAGNPEIRYQINGTGPDEAVIGFETYPLPQMREFDRTPPEEWVEFLLKRLDTFYTPRWIIERILQDTVYAEPALERRRVAQSLLPGCERFSEFQRRYSKETITDHHIRMLHHVASIHGFEMVFPYLTQELFELSFRAPYYAINDDVSYKNVYKRILLKFFDREFVYRPKIGFHAPSRRWFREPTGMGAILNQLPLQSCASFFNLPALREEVDWRLHSTYAPMDYLLWTLTSLVSHQQAA